MIRNIREGSSVPAVIVRLLKQRTTHRRLPIQTIFRTVLFCTLLLSACSAVPATPPTLAPAKAAPDPQNCGYQWAYQDLPELSASFQQSIQALQPEAQANAFAFGENCILSDGSIARFIPMETDFNITFPVTDLTNDAELGEWVVRVMEVITQIPAEQIVGPRPGRVSLIFKSGDEQTGINFYIDQFQNLAPGLSHAEIYQRLQASQ